MQSFSRPCRNTNLHRLKAMVDIVIALAPCKIRRQVTVKLNVYNGSQLAVKQAERDALAASVETYAAQTQQIRDQIAANDALIAELETSARTQMDSLNTMQEQLSELPAQILSGVTQISLAGGQLAAAQAAIVQEMMQEGIL